LAAGSYEFQASIAADAKNKSAVSACGTEPLTVQTQPAVTTVADPASAVVGADELKTASDTATFTNGHQLADQDVSFALFAKPDCTGATGIGGTVKIANDGQTATFTGDASALPAGTYYWYVSYAGDKYNKPVQECGGDTGVKNETLTLGAHAPKVTTVADPASAVIGADALKAASDTATFTDGYQLAGQDVSFALFAKPDCTGATGVGGTVKIANDGQTATFTGDASGLSAGTYYWYVSYGGDINNNPVQECGGDRGVENETLTIQKAQPTVTTTQDPASGSVGDTFKDKATLSGSVNQDGTGTITFNLYENPSCLEDPIYTETVPVSADGTYETPNGVKLDTPGAYYWVASFSGDSNNLPATSGCADEKVVVKPAEIHIVKTPDAAKVDVGSSIGFTLTVYNAGDGDAHGVTLSDTLPTNPGLSWTIASQGAGWAGSCAIAAGVLSCGPVTVPGGTTQAASAYTVHIKSSTTAATGGDCPGSGTVNNTGDVTSTNAGSDEASASTCVQALVDLSVTKAGSPATQILGTGNITWTIVVKNNGPDADTGVTITDPMPAGNSFVSATTTKGSCTGGAILTCNIGNMAAGETVTITLVTTPSTTGAQVNTVTASGNRPETNTGNNQASATVQVTPQVFPPPVVYCVAVSNVTPKQLFVGRKTTLTIHVTQHGKAKAGVKVLIRAPKLLLRTKRSNAKGIIKQHVKMKKAGAMIFTPIASKRCNTKRIGITNVFTPPVTG
jgi:uncharacterized repeat protein (TIGR01451 family)